MTYYVYTISSIHKHLNDGLMSRYVYVGSTDDYHKRWISHKTNHSNPNYHGYDCKVYQCMRNLPQDEMMFEVIEVVADGVCHKSREQFYIDKFESRKSLNTRNAVCDWTHRRAYQKSWRQRNGK